MNRPTLRSYRIRLLLLTVLGFCLTLAILKKKAAPAYAEWSIAKAIHAQRALGVDPASELEAARARLNELEKRLGASSVNGWQPVLDLLSAQGVSSGVQLRAIDAEHTGESSGLVLRTLPVSLQGRTVGLVEAIAAMERDALGVHLVSVDLRTTAASYRSARSLSATLYLQTLEP